MQRIVDVPAAPDRPTTAHKGTFGSALLVGGSRGMSGAIALSGLGALRAGAGLVFLGVPHEVAAAVSGVEPSYQVRSLPQDADGRVSADARGHLRNLITRCTAVGVGPGLGQSEACVALLRWLMTSAERPLVIDADGLNALARSPDALFQSSVWPAPRILTPHPGEFARLLGCSTADVQSAREDLAMELAHKTRATVVLKGAGTIVTDGERLFLNTTGNSGMATGGSGDVLTGITVALLAQGMDAFEACCLSVHLHGVAGDLAAASLSEQGLIASDLPDYLARAWQTLSP